MLVPPIKCEGPSDPSVLPDPALSWTCRDCGEQVGPQWFCGAWRAVRFCSCPGGKAKRAEDQRQKEMSFNHSVYDRLQEEYLKSNLMPGERYGNPLSFDNFDVDRRGWKGPRSLTWIISDIGEYLAGLMALPRRNLWLGGDTGTGKSHLAQAICAYARNKYGTPHNRLSFARVLWGEHLREIQSTWNRKNAASDTPLWRTLLETWMLVIDDIDAAPGNYGAWLIGTIKIVLDARNERNLPTIFTANSSVNGFADLIHRKRDEDLNPETTDAVIDRLKAQLYREYVFAGSSLRTAPEQQLVIVR